ncbi:efflux RND transporter permease subunit [Solemya velum gill symbiont]|uniref:RND transporter n=2 Tax=Solemya velum gill symbiont TaxID=2340 RepID=A0A1T2E528_SOVGS|nr:efflux RND transporter permease subunit [Solemya velum gill symbiont]OOY34102.1 RND transporter [Solemya velum gill symbiont]OOY39406.1 RND transporter [Solemya velum gill symbiont]OOY46228.1 RND transporter [Solemya velum gill symbiont]OOY49776.1 RND transporter [Solemya velum gill symbiont]OOY50142.1 RND transporter [Solemya velum gill symbiont]
MNERYAAGILRYRWLVIVATILLVALAASGGRFLAFSSDYRVFFSKENPQLTAFEELQNTYTKNDNVLIVLEPKGGNVFTRDVYEAIIDVTERSWQVPYSLRVDSLSNFQHSFSEEDDLTVIDLIDEPAGLSDEEVEYIKSVALKEPLLKRRLVSPQGHVTAINITVELPGLNPVEEVPDVVGKVREIAAYVEETYPDLQVYLTGVVMMNSAFAEASQYDASNLLPLAFLLIVVTVFIQLRGVVGTLVTALVIIMSVISAMGLAGWMGIPLTGPMMSAPAIILTLAVADCVHILTNWMQGLRQGHDKNQAMVESMRINFSPVFLTSATTAIGFLTLNFSDAPPFGDLGNTSAIGVIIAFLLSVSFLPALATLLPSMVKEHEQHDSHVMLKLADWIIKFRKQLLVGMGALILALVALVPMNETNDVFVVYFDERIQFRTDTDFVVENLTGVYFIDYSLNSGSDGGVSDPKNLQQVEDLANWLRAQPNVMHVSTITDVFKRLNRNMHGDDEAWHKLPQQRDLAAQYLLLYEMSLPYGLDLNNQIDINKQATRLSVTMETMSTNEVLEFEELVYDWMAENTPDILTFGASPTVMFSHIGTRNIKSMLGGTLVALVLISLILMVALKSWRYGFVSLVPNLAPAGMAFGIWAVIDGEIGLGVSVVTAMTLGIVVDDAIHFLSKYLRARREQGLDAANAVRYAFRTVGVALWVTSVALVAGFMVLATSSFELNSSMGLLVSIVIALALFADFFFLPPLLMRFDSWLQGSEKPKQAN